MEQYGNAQANTLSPNDFFSSLEFQQQQQQQQQHHHQQQQLIHQHQQQQPLPLPPPPRLPRQHHQPTPQSQPQSALQLQLQQPQQQQQQHHHQQVPQLPPPPPLPTVIAAQPATQQSINLQPGPRNYKSRKYRPCDFCRARQVACKIDVTPPCQLCTTHGRECTFIERPKKKRRPNASTTSDSVNGVEDHPGSLAGQTLALEHPHQPQVQVQHTQGGLQLDQNGFITHYDEHLFDRSLAQEQYIPHASFSQSPSQPHHQMPLNNGISPEFPRPSPRVPAVLQDRPLDSQLSRSARFVGETGESNPYLLRYYRYDENDECTVSRLTYRRLKRKSQFPEPTTGQKGEPFAVFMLADDSLAQKGEPRVEDDVLARARHDVAAMFTEEEALRLVGLYFRFVNPYFPILPRSEMMLGNVVSVEALRSLPLSLQAAIYATALPFMLYDDLLAATIIHSPQSPHQLYRIAWLAVTQELHTPRLATLQACLLLLQRAPTNRYTTDTPWKTSLVGWSVALAHILGLNHDCSDWSSLPMWELNLRKRLWHGVFIMDKWASLGAGMPSHIKADDFNVPAVVQDDCELALLDQHDHPALGFPPSHESDDHYRLLTELTSTLSDIMDAFYSVRATKRTAKDFSLSLEIARPLRSRLKAWNESLPPALSLRHNDRVDSRGMAKLSGNPALSLAYIVATMTLFRALLRPLENLTTVEEEDHGIVGSRRAVRAGAKECAKEVVEFGENLGRGALDAFWHSWSRANFAIASSFLMQLYLTSDTPAESAEISDLVARWRWAMRLGSGATGNGLMSLGLLRLDGLLLENNGHVEERRSSGNTS